MPRIGPQAPRHWHGRVPAGSGARQGGSSGDGTSQASAKPRGAEEAGATATARPHGHASSVLTTHMMQPMDQMSTSKLCPFLPSTSGAM